MFLEVEDLTGKKNSRAERDCTEGVQRRGKGGKSFSSESAASVKTCHHEQNKTET